MDGHGDAEDSEDDVGLPLDVDEGRGNEVSESEVEDPVARGSQSVGLATEVVGEQLWWVDPGDGAPSWGVRGNEEVGAGNDGLRCCTADLNRGFLDAANAVWTWVGTVAGEETTVGKELLQC